jgi:hypothetical protein
MKSVCRVCHCTEDMACIDGCRWGNKAKTICSRCVGKKKPGHGERPWCCSLVGRSDGGIYWHRINAKYGVWVMGTPGPYQKLVTISFCPHCGKQLPFT